jgi:alpha-glucosidase
MTLVEKRGVGAGREEGADLNNPPYAIHNGKIQSLYTTVAIRL